jgi:hypothetical protein
MSWRALFIVVGALAVLLIAGTAALRNRAVRYWMASEHLSSEQVSAALGGSGVVEVIQRPDRVEAVLLDRPEGENAADALDYQAASDVVPVPAQIAMRMGNVLTSPHRQVLGVKGCSVNYGVRVSFYAANDRVDVYFCFECGILEVHLNKQPVGGMNFDFLMRPLMREIRLLFPDNTGLKQMEAQETERWP